ncbi:alkaline shock response membrane anchor protein AmaP [Lactobacillus sp. DCY120]|uniref:Alkaline shock response membrane anchor protein AmaP n=1 Tax=Bombilactobacillus apium TaxID=2675299 RepID=A0A850R0S6_9LACO|nr:alkaline shock response membrane anchor protein AmaP [Bombilactobacillus apium]NVY96679.1 alkaline shock response membrane anchor protein AmaP [Bombilactobacillus apium]
MRKTSKWFLVLILLLSAPIPLYTLGETLASLNPWLPWHLPALTEIPTYLEIYLSLSAGVMLIVGLVFFLVTIFRPTNRKFNLIHKDTGRVLVTTKAINNFVLTSLKDEPYIHNCKVTSRLTQHKIKIKIRGELLPGEQLQGKFDQYLQELHTGLQDYLGLEQKPKINIQFQNYQRPERNNAPRVQ